MTQSAISAVIAAALEYEQPTGSLLDDGLSEATVASGLASTPLPKNSADRCDGQQYASSAARRSTKTPNQLSQSKAEIVLKKLRLTRGVTVAQIMEATGWQAHSVRGFLSAVVRKKLRLNLASEIGKDGQRRYRIVDGVA